MKIVINYTLFAVLAVDLLATSGDITMTWTSPIYPKLYSNDTSINPLRTPITSDEDAWIGSLINIGAIIGPLPFGFIAERMGRKIGLLCIAVPHIISYLTFAFAKNVYLFYFARILGGISVGGGYTLLPMYIAEVSDDANRGLYSVTLGIFWCFGNFLPYGIGPFLSIMWFNIILACVPLTFFCAFLLLGTETPYYLVGANKIEEAEKTLMKLRSRSRKDVQVELNDIKEQLKKEESGHFSDIFKNHGLRKALIISLLLIIFQQLSGINAVTFYLQPIFDASGSKISSDLSSVIVGLCMFLFSFVTPFVVNKMGRKLLLLISCVGMVISLSAMGAFFYIHDSTSLSTDSIFWLPILSLLSYILTFLFGISVIPWTLSSELFPNNVKQISASAVSSTCWITSFIVTKFFNNMTDVMGVAGTFWFYGGCCLVCAVVTILFVPETRGKSFKEIQDMLQQ